MAKRFYWSIATLRSHDLLISGFKAAENSRIGYNIVRGRYEISASDIIVEVSDVSGLVVKMQPHAPFTTPSNQDDWIVSIEDDDPPTVLLSLPHWSDD